MDISYKWLQQFVNLDVNPKDFVHKMCMTGTETTGYSCHADKIKNVVVGQIVKIEKHPDADKLLVCSVNIGQSENIQIVTAAQNVSEGDLVPVALHKSMLYLSLIHI